MRICRRFGDENTGSLRHAKIMLLALNNTHPATRDPAHFHSQRPWGEFFSRLSFPKASWLSYEKRVATNVAYFRANYAVLALCVSLWTLLRSPRTTFTLLGLVLMWTYALVVRRGPLIIGKRPVAVNASQRNAALGAASLLALLATGSLLRVAYVCALSVGAALLHASLRSGSIKANVHRMGTEMKGRVMGGSAAMRFGGPDGGALSGGGEDSTSDASPPSPSGGIAARAASKARGRNGNGKGSISDPEDCAPRGGHGNSYAPADMFKQNAGSARSGATTTTARRTVGGQPMAGNGGWVTEGSSGSGDGGMMSMTPVTAINGGATLMHPASPFAGGSGEAAYGGGGMVHGGGAGPFGAQTA